MEKLAFSLGFFEPIDKQKKCLAVFLAIVSLSRMGRGISSTTLSRQLGLSRGSTLNHLGTLMHRGLVIKKGRHYQLRGANLEATLLLVERDIQNWLTDAKTLARNWDELAI
jgi:DNA-binding IclR family transcriptional regulator